ncbi:apolipoprotein L3-like [Peromyscus leucopus]|uniref:apolipoprotein L3-like n=1 Tax=Peromyscus leucopus TaxID=10041 RepID=UPI0010A0EBD8|nr:apolipoprotein L3-like [Peromyscus leucopus]
MYKAAVVGTRVVSEITDWLVGKYLREDLKSLITEDGAWKAFVEAAELSSDQEVALRDALEKHLAQEPTDEKDRLERELQKKRFLEQFPELKRKLEEHIRKLRDLADHLDQVHKGCTISNVVSGSVGTASGVLGILGLALAPFTGGASLLVSATAAGLGAAAGVTGLTTSIVEDSSQSSDEAEARRLVGASKSILQVIRDLIPKDEIKIFNTGVDLVNAWKTIGQQIRAFRVARTSSRSGTQARNLGNFAQGSERMGSALPGSATPVTRGARIRKIGFTSIILLLDGIHLVTDSMDLYNGATTESGRALRDLAHKLEEKLQKFEQIHKALQSDLPQ